MIDKRNEKYPIPEQHPEIRNKNWDEVSLGYNDETAVKEAARCLQCNNRPCVAGCPVAVDIPNFIASVKNGDFKEAYKIIKKTNSLPAVCGRVCPQESQCEGKCVRGIKGESVAIGALERFCADWAINNDVKTTANGLIKSNGIKVAVIGSGPAGLTCAGDLIALGYDVTIFEALHKPGGVLVYGIPEFRLPKAIVNKEINNLIELGVRIEKNVIVGSTVTIDELFEEGYKAVFIGSGAGLPGFLSIPGESSNGVYSANEFLTRINLMKAYDKNYNTPVRSTKDVIVVGGGNVAMDAARCAKRLGIENVYIVYRRSETEMPARIEEVRHAKEENIIFKTLVNPVKINADESGNVKSVICVEMKLGDPDSSGRKSVTVIDGSEFEIEADTVVIAVGTTPNPLIGMTTPGLEINKKGCVVTRDDGVTTNRDGIFAGGDIVTGAATVILAMGAGKTAAAAIDDYIKNL